MLRWMKRLAALSVMMALLVSAAYAEELRGYDPQEGYVYVNLGQYPQTAEGEYLPIIWRVLSTDEEKAYLASEYVLLAHRVHPDDDEYIAFGGDFAQTEICQFLNSEFIADGFTEEEMALILPHEQYGSFFLLDSADLNNKELGFGTDKSRKAWGTEYAIKVTGLFVYGVGYGSHSPYWTRNQSTTSNYASRCTKDGGELGWIRVVVANEGCRPACYLDMSKIEITGGAGTLEDPYSLGGKVQ